MLINRTAGVVLFSKILYLHVTRFSVLQATESWAGPENDANRATDTETLYMYIRLYHDTLVLAC